MSSKNGQVPQISDEEMKKKIETIEHADACKILLFQLLKEMGLPRGNLPMQTFTDRYAEIQAKALEIQKEFQEMHMIANPGLKQKQKRKSKVERELEKWEEFPEKTDTFSNGDYK